MKINTPDILIKPELADDKVEGARLLLAFMYRLAHRKHSRGFDNVRYYIQSADVRMFLRGYVKHPSIHFLGFDTKYFRIGVANDDIWVFDWKERPPLTFYDYLTPETCATWGYIVGRGTNTIPFTEYTDGGIPKKQEQVMISAEDRKFFAFTSWSEKKEHE
tara:strand:- start:325 stop:807 length:483 start_codon:yes stop_codon:yes gene_type:complete